MNVELINSASSQHLFISSSQVQQVDSPLARIFNTPIFKVWTSVMQKAKAAAQHKEEDVELWEEN